MSDRKIGMKNAIKSADFAPRRLLGQPDETRQLFLGTLVGIASSIHEQDDPQDENRTMYALRGAFRFIDADDKISILQGPVLWVPPSLHDPVADLIKSATEQTDPDTGEVTKIRGAKAAVDMAFKVYSIRSTAPVGYTWLFEPLIQPTANDPTDPLAALMARVGVPLSAPGDTKALTDQSSEHDAQDRPGEPGTVAHDVENPKVAAKARRG